MTSRRFTLPPMRSSMAAAVTVALAALAMGCAGADEDAGGSAGPSSPKQQTDPAPSGEAPVARDVVILVSIDGLGSDALNRSQGPSTPTLDRLRSEGASTTNARSDHDVTLTLPNHTSMLTGLPVATHRVTFNSDNGGVLADTAGRYLPSIFDRAHDHGLRTALYTSKDKFDFLDRSWDAEHGERDLDPEAGDNGPDKIDTYVREPMDAMVSAASSALKSAPADLTFVHIAAPDRAGHAHGWDSRQYEKSVERSDRALSRIVQAVESDPGLHERATVLLTSDHGGHGSGHSRASDPLNFTLPLVAWGADVAQGADLYELNAARTDPGVARGPASGPLRNRDVAATAVALLGLPQLSQTDGPIALE